MCAIALEALKQGELHWYKIDTKRITCNHFFTDFQAKDDFFSLLRRAKVINKTADATMNTSKLFF
jgi:hypothetical protein